MALQHHPQLRIRALRTALLAALAASTAALAQPANDEFAGALPVLVGVPVSDDTLTNGAIATASPA